MNGFSAEWLALREPYDRRARNVALERRLVERLAVRRAASLPVVDLGGGTGANLRHLAPRIGGAQRWCIVENDATLIAALPQALAAWAGSAGHGFREVVGGWRIDGAGFSAGISVVQRDLARELPALPIDDACLVTASALLDLVSGAWLDALLRRCAAARAGVLFALTCDGTIDWSPADAGDAWVRDAFNAHQRRDKGFGPALGPLAVGVVQRSLAALGYAVEVATSDWSIGIGDEAIARALLAGWADAAIDVAPHAREPVSRWRERRAEAVAGARATVVVGHRDLLGWPGL